MKVQNREELVDFVRRGGKLKFLFFWGHTGHGGKASLSQWYKANFEVDSFKYSSAEQYMMAEKARIFGDEVMREQILASQHPAKAKKLGRLVANFDEQVWNANRLDIVVAGNLAKFRQNEHLGRFLCSTKERILVEASPVDNIWGVGLSADQPDIADPKLWKGDNLLGFALMKVREVLLRENCWTEGE